ncbi:unnamed protein product [Schistocephalus solidus]|uniref:Uncharacterized protein n=1 Tax=Schistocephalus solidus TaxID=70667 RepID=A0A3P7C5K9_SCHSO|nr:unnamed protein product [Schistocephalus solidus]
MVGAADKKSRKESTSEVMKEAGELTKVSANVAEAASLAGHMGRTTNLRDKFESGAALDQKDVKRRKAKVRYAGVDTMKNKFMEEAQKATNRPTDEDAPRKLKEITPPREGVVVGTLESEPKARPPGIVASDDYPVEDFKAIGESTKSMREKFKKLEKTGGTTFDEDDTEKKDVKQIDPATSEATRSAKARWKDIESGKTEQVLGKLTINLNGPGGVYENEPDSLVNIARGQDKGEPANIIITTSAAERREAFLKKATAEGSVKRLDPANAVYENTPAPRPDDVIAAEKQEDDLSKLKTAKTIREKFADPKHGCGHLVVGGGDDDAEDDDDDDDDDAAAATDDDDDDGNGFDSVIDMHGEGGVYENEPERREDVIHYDESDDQPEPGAVKWASSAKERFMKDAEERSKAVRRTESIAVEEAGEQGTGGKFATTAKQQFLERQREAEEAAQKKARPGIIDIWSELPKESGVFENVPAARAEGIVVSGMYSDDEEEEEEEET